MPGASAPARAAQPHWEQIFTAGSDSMPGRGQHGFTVTPRGDLYVFGGSHWVTRNKTRTYELLGDFWCRPDGGRFRDLTAASACPIPPTIEPHLASDAEGRVYEFGGVQNAVDGTFANRLYRYDPAVGRWSDLTPPDSPAGREDHGFVGDWKRDRLWLFGGVDGHAVQLGDLWFYDVARGTWQELVLPAGAPRPAARELYDLVWDGRDALYLFGGYNDVSGYLHDLWRYDIQRNTWVDLTAASGAEAISPRSYAGMAIDPNGVLWLAGGYASPYAAGGFWRYDTRGTGRWTDLSALAPPQMLPRATFEMVCHPLDHALYLLGGMITTSPESQIHRNDLWRFETRPAIVARMPQTGLPLVRGASATFDITAASASGHPIVYRWRVDGRSLTVRGTRATLGPFCSGKHYVVAEAIDGALRDTTCWSFEVTGSEAPDERVLDLIAQRDSGGVVLRWIGGGDGLADSFRVYVKAAWDSTWKPVADVPALHGLAGGAFGRCESVVTIDSLLAAGVYGFRVVAVTDGAETPGAEREVEIVDISGAVPVIDAVPLPSVLRDDGVLLVRQDAVLPLRVRLFTAGGRLVRTLFDGTPAARLTVVPVPVRGVPRGLYFVHVSNGAGDVTRRIVVTR